MSADSSLPEIVTDSGLVVSREFVETLESVGLEQVAMYYKTMYKLFFE